MLNFDFYNPTRILFGQGRIADLDKVVPAEARVLILYGGGSIKSNGVLDEVHAALGTRHLAEFAGIEPNPSYETLMRAVLQVREQKLDFLLAVGGGSVIDGTKFVAAAVNFPGEPTLILEKFGRNVTRRDIKNKTSFTNRLLFPQFSILDPSKTFSLPIRQIGNGVVDAYIHVMEQYLTYPASAPLQDRFAEGILQTLIEEGPKALENPEDYEVRSNIMWCATLALNGLIGAGVPQDWATHMVGHELTALYGLDHAQTLAIILPSMLRVRKHTKRDKLLQYAERVWDLRGGDEDMRIEAAISKTQDFFESMNVKTRLSDYSLGADCIDAVLTQLESHRLTSLGEKRDVTLDVTRKVLELSL